MRRRLAAADRTPAPPWSPQDPGPPRRWPYLPGLTCKHSLAVRLTPGPAASSSLAVLRLQRPRDGESGDEGIVCRTRYLALASFAAVPALALLPAGAGGCRSNARVAPRNCGRPRAPAGVRGR